MLVGELFVPVRAADPFSRAILDWTEGSDIDEIAVLSGVPLAHGPDEHGPFYVATEDYYERRIEGTDVDPMGRGFLDGVDASLIERGLDTDLGVGVFVTPAHARTPDVDAALRLLSVVESAYELDIDTGPLEGFADELRQHYAQLSERLAADDRDRPEDRMFM